ncbi:MAG: DUF72 domain-containing protein [Nitrospirales bacterium]
MCCELWEEITFPRFASHVRYGVKAGQPNLRFLDATLFNEMVRTSYREAKFQPHAGPFLFEFQRHDLPTEEFCSRLAGFFDQLPREFRYGVEIRNPALLGPQYHRVLERDGVAHIYNHWSYMPPPPLAEQHARMDGFTPSFTVLRLLTPLRISYEAAKKRAEPYTKIVEVLPEMRRETVDLVSKAVAGNRRAYVLVNNRPKGNAPLIIQGLADQLRDVPT